MARTTAAIVPKGGTGKTSTICCLAEAAALHGQRSLVIDLDPQGSATIITGTDPTRPGSFDLISGRETASAAIQHSKAGFDVIAGSADLASLQTSAGSAYRLARSIAPLQTCYDWILLDCGPTVGESMTNALFCATDVITPLRADLFGLQALYQVASTVKHVQRFRALTISGALITSFDARSKVDRFWRKTIEEKAKAMGIRYLGEIRSGVAIREAQSRKQGALASDPKRKSKAVQDYWTLYSALQEAK